jgi:hypothetical protein
MFKENMTEERHKRFVEVVMRNGEWEGYAIRDFHVTSEPDGTVTVVWSGDKLARTPEEHEALTMQLQFALNGYRKRLKEWREQSERCDEYAQTYLECINDTKLQARRMGVTLDNA